MPGADLYGSPEASGLERFLGAQNSVYESARGELRRGRKESHWMWFIFPQIAGLGRSAMAQKYALSSRAEAKEYLEHAVLGPRLVECTDIVNGIEGRSAEQIFGSIDAMKFRSSMTLFNLVAESGNVFGEALERYFEGRPDPLTLDLAGPAGSE